MPASLAAASVRLTGTPKIDSDRLSAYIADREDSLLQLPPPAARNPDERRVAAELHAANRSARLLFMSTHADWIYESLTNNLATHKRAEELSFGAAELVPGLVPTRGQLSRERQLNQRDKEGYEVDQGIFFSGILRSERSGTHLLHSMMRPSTRARSLLHSYIESGAVELSSISLHRAKATAYLTIHNLSSLNAEDDDLIDDMETAIDIAVLDPATTVCVLRGGLMTHPRYTNRRVFSSGINLNHLARGQISFLNFLLRREMSVLGKLRHGLILPLDGLRPIASVSKPWIAVVDSFAIGGGMQLLLVADHVIAASDAFLSLPAAHEGIIPGVANLRLSAAVGPRLARQIILLGRKISANDPEASLLIDKVAAPTDLDTAVDEAVIALSAPAVIPNRMLITSHEEPFSVFRAYLADFSLQQALRLYSSDVMEKVWKSSSRPADPC